MLNIPLHLVIIFYNLFYLQADLIESILYLSGKQKCLMLQQKKAFKKFKSILSLKKARRLAFLIQIGFWTIRCL